MSEMNVHAEWAEIEKLAGDDDWERHKIGGHYNNIVGLKLAEAAGYPTALDFFTEKLAGLKTLSQSTLTSYGSVARNFSEEQAVRFGVNALVSFQTWRKLSGDDGLAPEEAMIGVPGNNGELTTKPLDQCSMRELKSALRVLRLQRSSARAESVPAEVLERVERMQAALDERLGADHPSDIEISVRKGEVSVSFEKLPFAQIDELLGALRQA